MTITNPLFGLVIGGLLISALSQVAGYTIKDQKNIRTKLELQLQRQLLQRQLKAYLRRAIPGDLMMSVETAKALGIEGSTVPTTWPTKSIWVKQAATLGSSSTPQQGFTELGVESKKDIVDVIVLLIKHPTTAPLAVARDSILTHLNHGELNTIPVVGNLSQYQAGDIVAVVTPVGTEFASVHQASATDSTLTFRVSRDAGTFAANYLPSGATIFKVASRLIGVPWDGLNEPAKDKWVAKKLLVAEGYLAGGKTHFRTIELLDAEVSRAKVETHILTRTNFSMATWVPTYGQPDLKDNAYMYHVVLTKTQMELMLEI